MTDLLEHPTVRLTESHLAESVANISKARFVERDGVGYRMTFGDDDGASLVVHFYRFGQDPAVYLVLEAALGCLPADREQDVLVDVALRLRDLPIPFRVTSGPSMNQERSMLLIQLRGRVDLFHPTAIGLLIDSLVAFGIELRRELAPYRLLPLRSREAA